MDNKYDVIFTFDVCAPTGAVQAVPRRFCKSISTNGFNRSNSQTWHRLANGGIGGESEVHN